MKTQATLVVDKKASAQIRQLERRIAALEPDALRYRYLTKKIDGHSLPDDFLDWCRETWNLRGRAGLSRQLDLEMKLQVPQTAPTQDRNRDAD